MASKLRPEHQAPPEIYYDEAEAKKYSSNSRVIEIQEKMSERAIELLMLPPDSSCLLLDIGCGSGLSGEVITEQGHQWMGVDISSAMLDIARDREVEGDVMLGDVGQGLPFRAGIFDGVISISALQWLCNADKRSHHPPKRLLKFFTMLYSSMRSGTRAVFQIYPETPQQLELITKQATRAGFGGGVVVDYPNSSKAKKIFLCLLCGNTNQALPQALGTGAEQRNKELTNMKERMRSARHGGKGVKSAKQWINDKKERYRRQGKEVRENSKYTGKRRKPKF